MRVAVPTSELTAQQRSERVDQLVVDVNALKAQVDKHERGVHEAHRCIAQITDYDQPSVTYRVRNIAGIIARLNEIEAEQKRPSTLWQRLRWLFRG